MLPGKIYRHVPGGKTITITPRCANYKQDWNRIWDNGYDDIGRSTATDLAGNVYLAGDTRQVSAHSDALLVKYSANGTSLWNQLWGESDDEMGLGVTTDNLNNVYLTGSTYIGSECDAFLAKFTSEGMQLWNQTWGGTQYDAGGAIAVNSSGNVVIIGSTASYGSGGFDAFLATYNSEGVQLWNQTWGGNNDDFGRGVSIDAGGNIYLTGETESFGVGGADAFLAKYSSDGTSLWNRTWGTNSHDIGRSVVTDKSGNTFITGQQEISSGIGSVEVFLAKYTPDGSLLWITTWNGWRFNYGEGVAIDGFGSAYVAGSVEDDHNHANMFILKYTSEGTLLLSEIWGDAGEDYGDMVAMDQDGNVFVAGRHSQLVPGSIDAVIVKYTIVPPLIAVNLPASGALCILPPQFNVTITEPELSASWYTVGASVTNHTFQNNMLTNVDDADWNGQPDGMVIIKFWGNNSQGLVQSGEISVMKITTAIIVGGFIIGAVVFMYIVIRRLRS